MSHVMHMLTCMSHVMHIFTCMLNMCMHMWQEMMMVMQLTSGWDALTARICTAVLKTWLDGSTLHSKKVPEKRREDYIEDVEKGMKVHWLGISDTPALMAGTTLAMKKAEERVEQWATSDVLRWLVDIDEKAYLGLFAEKGVTGETLLMFSKCPPDYAHRAPTTPTKGCAWSANDLKTSVNLKTFVEKYSAPPRCPASPRAALLHTRCRAR